ncbi:MAG: fatty acid desaturase [Candidatus Melainabacteria bacterium]|nr:fatty acid desaturase [Candidatus Melainabacteria bacterium]
MSNIHTENPKFPEIVRFPSNILLELNKKTPIRNILHILFCTGLFILLGLFNTQYVPWYLWPLLWLFQGFMMVGYLSISHDGAHFSLFHRPWQNLLCGRLCSLVILQCFSVYRAYHMEHHAHTATDKDTEPRGEFEDLKDYLLCLSGIQFALDISLTGWDTLRGKYADYLKTPGDRSAAKQDTLALIAWLFLMLMFTWQAPQLTLNLYWGPILFYFPAVIYSGLLEHYGCEESINPLTNTRSVRPGRIFNFFDWNAGYHAEHHLFPAMPSRSYPKVASILGSSLKYIETSYFQFHWRLIQQLLNKKQAHRNLTGAIS